MNNKTNFNCHGPNEMPLLCSACSLCLITLLPYPTIVCCFWRTRGRGWSNRTVLITSRTRPTSRPTKECVMGPAVKVALERTRSFQNKFLQCVHCPFMLFSFTKKKQAIIIVLAEKDRPTRQGKETSWDNTNTSYSLLLPFPNKKRHKKRFQKIRLIN